MPSDRQQFPRTRHSPVVSDTHAQRPSEIGVDETGVLDTGIVRVGLSGRHGSVSVEYLQQILSTFLQWGASNVSNFGTHSCHIVLRHWLVAVSRETFPGQHF